MTRDSLCFTELVDFVAVEEVAVGEVDATGAVRGGDLDPRLDPR